MKNYEDFLNENVSTNRYTLNIEVTGDINEITVLLKQLIKKMNIIKGTVDEEEDMKDHVAIAYMNDDSSFMTVEIGKLTL